MKELLHYTAVAIDECMIKQKAKFGSKPIATDMQFISILGEEFGEICRAINQNNIGQAKHECLQTIAVISAHLQGDLHYGEEP